MSAGEGRALGESGTEVLIARRLLGASETLVVVETSAGGLVSARLTALPGSSGWFLGGATVYSATARLRWLGLSAEATRASGVVSPETALALARAGREFLGATWGAAETGIAGPQTGRRSTKPVGLAYVAVAGQSRGRDVERVVEVSTGLDDRDANRRAFADALLRLLLECLG